jgi:hypothetical protein
MAFDLAAHLKNTKPTRPSHPFLPTGRHVLDVLEIRKFESADSGTSYAADFIMVESDNDKAKPGAIYSALFKVMQRPQRAEMTSDADRMVAFAGALVGAPDLESARAAANKVAGTDEALKMQKARGIRVGAFGKNPKEGKTYVPVDFSFVVQTKADIAARRAALDISHPRGTVPVALDPEPVAPPAASGGMLDDL